MIRHCVFIRFRPEIGNAERQALFGEIAALKPRLPGFLAAHVAPNTSPETGMDKGYSDGFIVDFADAFARDAYLDDAEHKKTGAKLVAAAQGGVEGILVYDLEVPDPT
ncbi:MAG TPA: Dabb family protein [Devosiaceae bacterium]